MGGGLGGATQLAALISPEPEASVILKLGYTKSPM
jgi:hypothetical protein